VVPAVGRTDEMEKLKRRSECCARLCPDQNINVQLVTDDLLTLVKAGFHTACMNCNAQPNRETSLSSIIAERPLCRRSKP
jgi:hypothetical protein